MRPTVDCGALPAKATQGLPLRIEATVVADSHDPLIAVAGIDAGPET
ncbi:MAG: DUF3416 domain-containing protein, partial [Candidatus Dormibacteraeota bacterium]|nr:DUF3416 domain-containing protein [Candidatus Dormibacteraeota bacterium]